MKFNKHCQQSNMPTSYRLCYAEEPEDHIVEVFKPNPAYPVFKTYRPILFSEQKLLQTCRKALSKYSHFYSYLISELKDKEIRIYGYRKTIYDFQAKRLYYCMKDILFMGEYIFISYSPERVCDIVSALFMDYDIQEAPVEGNFYIEDEEGTRIFFFDSGFEVNIRYFSYTNTLINGCLSSYFSAQQEKQKE